MSNVQQHLEYCRFCLWEFTGPRKVVVKADKKAHETVCRKNPNRKV